MKREWIYLLGIILIACLQCFPESVGILVSKKSGLYAAPVKGFQSVISGALVLNMEGKKANGVPHCEKLKAAGVKVVFVVGKKAAKAAIKNLPGIPLVYGMVMKPEKAGIKGKMVTGVSLNVPFVKQFAAFKSVVPNLKKIGIVYSDKTAGSWVSDMKSNAGKSGLTVIEKKVASDKEVPNAIRALKGKIDGLYLPPDRKVTNRDAFQFITLFTFENNLPFMAPTSRFVKKGALIALLIDYENVGKQAGGIVKKIVGGKSPSQIPVEPPNTTILVLNQKTAKTIGINIPPALMGNSQIIK